MWHSLSSFSPARPSASFRRARADLPSWPAGFFCGRRLMCLICVCVCVCRCPLAWWFIVYYLIFSALFQLALKRSLESQAGTSTRKRLQMLIVVVQTIFVDARLCSIIIRLGVVSQSALFCKCTMNAVNSELDSLHNCLVALSKVKFSMCTLWQQLSNASWVRLN